MDMVMNKVGTYMLQQNASKELSSVTNEIGSFTHGIGGGKKWLVDKVKETTPESAERVRPPSGPLPSRRINLRVQGGHQAADRELTVGMRGSLQGSVLRALQHDHHGVPREGKDVRCRGHQDEDQRDLADGLLRYDRRDEDPPADHRQEDYEGEGSV
ncbi:uncharacterized protein LOC109822640 isoform X2 [Asparagus officinalis]|uniref:uncharacterized protein LOC109822640 isoform X2 n=1 Tax=Asparagus officinalis TaxID=4686 RepID=UPI00098E4F96|nr:uncharacterized protein LOC109822640 isoform X2 [Asparagus officinalis]